MFFFVVQFFLSCTRNIYMRGERDPLWPLAVSGNQSIAAKVRPSCIKKKKEELKQCDNPSEMGKFAPENISLSFWFPRKFPIPRASNIVVMFLYHVRTMSFEYSIVAMSIICLLLSFLFSLLSPPRDMQLLSPNRMIFTPYGNIIGETY